MVEKMISTQYQYDFVQKHLQNLCETSGDSGVLIYYDKKNKQLKYWCKILFHITSNKTFIWFKFTSYITSNKPFLSVNKQKF